MQVFARIDSTRTGHELLGITDVLFPPLTQVDHSTIRQDRFWPSQNLDYRPILGASNKSISIYRQIVTCNILYLVMLCLNYISPFLKMIQTVG